MWIVLWLILAVVVGALASGKGRSGFGWFVIAILISPLIALVVLLVAGEGRGGRKRCPECLGWVDTAARRCRHCGEAFDAPRRRAAPKRAAPPPRPRQIFQDAPPEPPAAPAPGGYVGLTKDGRRVNLPEGWSGGRREPKL